MRAGLVSRAGWIACMLVTAGLSLFPGSERETTEPGCLPVPELRVVTVSEQGGAPAGLTYISLRGTAWGRFTPCTRNGTERDRLRWKAFWEINGEVYMHGHKQQVRIQTEPRRHVAVVDGNAAGRLGISALLTSLPGCHLMVEVGSAEAFWRVPACSSGRWMKCWFMWPHCRVHRSQGVYLFAS